MVVPRAGGRRLLASGVVWAALAGVVFAVAGFAVALSVVHNPVLRLFVFSPEATPYLTALAAFLVGGPCWWLIVERPRRPTRGRGAVVGLLTGLLAHPVMWTLVFASEDPATFTDPAELLTPRFWDGLLLSVLVFTLYSLPTVGVLTVVLGIVAGLALAAGRRRVAPWTLEAEQDAELSERSTGFWVANATVVGVTVIVLFSLTGGVGFLVLVASGLATAVVTLVALRRLPVVRTVLTGRTAGERGATGGEESVAELTDRTFLVRYGLGTLGLGVAYVLVFFGYGFAVDHLSNAVLPGVSLERDLLLFYGYPVLFTALCLAVALALNYRRNRWRPSTSRLRPVLEWTAFLALAVTTYTLGLSAWLS